MQIFIYSARHVSGLYAQPSGPAPNNTKDICSICKEIIPLFAPEDGHIGPKHVELNK